MISQDLPPSITTRDISKFVVVSVTSKGKISFEIPPALSLSQNSSIVLSESVTTMFPSFLLTTINSKIFLFVVPLMVARPDPPNYRSDICKVEANEGEKLLSVYKA